MRNDLCGDWRESNHDATESRNFISRNFHSRLFRFIPFHILTFELHNAATHVRLEDLGPIACQKSCSVSQKLDLMFPRKGTLWNAKSHFWRFRKFYFYDRFGAKCKREKRANISNINEQWARKKKISYANFRRVFARVARWGHKW